LPEILSKYIECYVYRFECNEIKYLLLKRSKEKEPYPGIWQIVTGKMEADEEAFKTALREVNEETGLDIKNCFVHPKINEFYTPHNDKIYLIPVFAAEVSDTNVKLSDEHVSFEWLDFTSAFNRIHWYSQKENLNILNDILSGKVQNTMIQITNSPDTEHRDANSK
jgi:dihydroneopterin triphosphate diphosphatase